MTPNRRSNDNGHGTIHDELTALCRQWSEAMGRGDVEAIMSLFAEDAVFVIAGAPLVRGAAAIRERFGAGLNEGRPAPTFEPGQIWESGDLVVDVGSIHIAGDPPRRGKYVVVWERQADGSLKALVDAPSTD